MNTQLLDLRTVNLIDISAMAATTENRLAAIRAEMHYYKTRYLIRRQGWAYSEPRY
jgi:hypothetical protein